MTVDTSDLLGKFETPGIYYVAYTAPWTETTSVRRVRTVRVLNSNGIEPSRPPTIQLLGNNPDTVRARNGVYVDPGARALDAEDSDISAGIEVLGEVDISTEGIYSLTYFVTDLDGNQARAVRLVYVVDSDTQGRGEGSYFILNGRNPDTVLIWSDANIDGYADPGATAFFAESNRFATEIAVVGKVNINVPGEYDLLYMMRDDTFNLQGPVRKVVVTWPAGDPELFMKYGVPMTDSIPSFGPLFFHSFSVEGEGPDLSTLTQMEIYWTPRDTILHFHVNGDLDTPTNWSAIARHTFRTERPAILIQESQIPGMDGPYWIRVEGQDMHWVAFSGDFVITWKDGSTESLE